MFYLFTVCIHTFQCCIAKPRFPTGRLTQHLSSSSIPSAATCGQKWPKTHHLDWCGLYWIIFICGQLWTWFLSCSMIIPGETCWWTSFWKYVPFTEHVNMAVVENSCTISMWEKHRLTFSLLGLHHPPWAELGTTHEAGKTTSWNHVRWICCGPLRWFLSWDQKAKYWCWYISRCQIRLCTMMYRTNSFPQCVSHPIYS